MFGLDLRSRTPIYEQLVERIIELIINNVLKADEQLPSVRALSGELSINPNTIQKAYRELENRGYIYSLPGKGNFVRTAAGGDYSVRLRDLKNQLTRIVAEMLYLGMPAPEIIEITKKLVCTVEGGKMDD